MSQTIDRAIVMFSTGIDSCVMFDLFSRFMPGRFVPVYLYMVQGLSWTERVIRAYERRYGVRIKQHTHPLTHCYMPSYKQKRKPTLPDMEAYLRKLYQTEYIAYGYMKVESIERRGMLALKDSRTKETIGEKGVNYKHRKLYPLSEWKKRDIKAYVKDRKLIIPETYEYGYRDITNFTGDEVLLLIRNSYPEDFQKIITTYPTLKAEYIRQFEAL